jgi:uroporphyrinogen-III synthase
VLLDLDAYDGVIVTSPRASKAIIDALQGISSPEVYRKVLKQLQQTTIYSVGLGTSQPLLEFGDFACLGDESGSAEALGEFIASVDHGTKPMVFLCGEKRHDALPESFRRRSRALKELVVYASTQVNEIEWLQANIPEWVVFFSPSGVDVAKRMISVDWPRIHKAAIGTTSLILKSCINI